jgi:hypothetical protein
MPHGDFSDIGAIALLGGGFMQIFKTEMCFQALGPLKPMITSPATDQQSMMLQMMGGFMVILGCMLFTVRWNTVNGKLSGLACIGCAANIATIFDVKSDLGPQIADKLSLIHIYTAVMLLAGLHLMFNANPLIKAADGKKSK